ncbi:MAG TPA: ABC transporter permease [Actinocrinis sp.]|nr:ABC transporter permease [Actinocrinis sp.]
MSGTLALTRLEIRRALRNRRVMFFAVMYPVGLYLLIGSTVSGTASNGVSAKAYVLIAMASFGALGAALTTNATKIALERKEGWTRQLRLTALPGGGYVVGKVAAATVITVPALVVVFGAGAATGIHQSATRWITAFLIMWIGSLAFTGLGIAIGYGVPNDSVQMVSMITYLGLAVIGGLFVPFSGTMAKIGAVSPSYQVRQLGTDAVNGIHLPAHGLMILGAWVVGAAALAAVMYRRGAAEE